MYLKKYINSIFLIKILCKIYHKDTVFSVKSTRLVLHEHYLIL